MFHIWWHRVKLFLGWGSLVALVWGILETTLSEAVLGADRAAALHGSAAGTFLAYARLGVVCAAWPCLTVDAFLRRYTELKELAVALALFPVTTPVYFLIWGRQRLQPLEAVYHDQFCRRCLAESEADEAGSTVTLNLLFGSRFLGSRRRCPTCGSTVRTLWYLWGLPLFPRASYRVLYVAEGRYLSRRAALDHLNVALVYGLGLAVGIPLIIWLARQ